MKIVFLFIIPFLLFACSHGEEEIIIVPKNYTGYVVIVYNQKKGAAPKYEGKKRVYEMPQDGILKTQFEGNYGFVGFTEFYYEKIAKENRIPFKFDYKNVPLDTIVGHGGTAVNANKNLEGTLTVEYRLFYVGNKEQIDSAYINAEKLDVVKLAE